MRVCDNGCSQSRQPTWSSFCARAIRISNDRRQPRGSCSAIARSVAEGAATTGP
jgi:hypothetical protein